MNEVLKIEVQAQVAQAQAALRQLQTSLKGTEQAAAGVTKQMPKLGQSTNGANVALVNFGRVVQDAPFGLIGIANNIDPLLTSLQNLQSQTKESGGAFKALRSALVGPAGIAIAVSAVTSLLIVYGDEIRNALSGINKFEQALIDAGNKGAESFSLAKNEISNLVRIANDGNVSLARQRDAFEDANKKLSEYGLKIKDLQTFQKEGAQIGLLYAQVKQEEAKASFLAAKAAESYVKQISIQQRAQAGDALGTFGEFGFLDKLKTIIGSAGNAGTGALAFAKAYGNTIGKAAQEENFFNTELEKSNQTISKLIESIKNITGVTEDFGKKTKPVTDILKQYREQLSAIQFKEQALNLDLLNEKIKLASDTFTKFLESGVKQTSKEFIFINSELNRFISQIQTLNKTGQQGLLGLGLKDAVPNLDALIKKSKEFIASGLPEKATKTTTLTLTPEAYQKQKELIEEVAKEQQRLNDLFNVSDQLINSIAGEFADLFTNLSKDGVKAFEDIAKSIAQTTQRILIQYAVTQALKSLLNSIAPGSGSISDLIGVQGGGTSNLDIRNLRILG